VRLSADAKAVLVMVQPKAIAAGEFVFEPGVPRKRVVSWIRREWARAWKKAKLPKVRFHDLRQHADYPIMPNLHRMTAAGGARAVF
ncbi:MAG: hypothetical protein WB607_09980, partial [Candidatus Acidiferrum sp.]|jgi:hypothetical protein